MEAAFGEDFSGVNVRLGQRSLATARVGAATDGQQVDFASEHPDRAMVAHELAHVVQHRRNNKGDHAMTPALSQRGDPSEREARQVAERVAGGGWAGPIVERPSARVHFWDPSESSPLESSPVESGETTLNEPGDSNESSCEGPTESVEPMTCEVPAKVPTAVDLQVPSLTGDEHGQRFEERLQLGSEVYSSTQIVLYSVPNHYVFATPEEASTADCDPERHVSEVLAIGPIGGTGYTVSGPIEILTLTPEYAITPTYTRFAVGAGSAALARTAEGLMLVDGGVQIQFGGRNRGPGMPDQALAEALARRVAELAAGEPIVRALVTHSHGDHINALPHIAELVEIQRVQLSFEQAQVGVFQRVLEQVLQAQERYRDSVLPRQVEQRLAGRRPAWLAEQPLTLQVDDARAEAAWRQYVEELIRSEQMRMRTNPLRVEVEITAPEGTPMLVQAELVRSGNQAAVDLPEGTRRGGVTSDVLTRGEVITWGHPEADAPSRFHPDTHASSYIIRLATGELLIVASDPRDRDLSESMERFRRAMSRVGASADITLVEAGHHGQRGTFTLERTDERPRGRIVDHAWINDATQLLSEIAAQRGPSGEASRTAVVVGGSEARISPAHAWFMRAIGFEAYITTTGSTELSLLDVFETDSEARFTVLDAEPRAGERPSHRVLFEASMERIWLQGEVARLLQASASGDPELVAEHTRVQAALHTLEQRTREYIDRFNEEIGRGTRGAERARPAVAPPEGAGEVAPAELAALTAHLEVVASMRPAGTPRIDPAAAHPDASTILVLADQVEGRQLSDRQARILEHVRALRNVQGEPTAGAEVSRASLLGHMEALVGLLRAEAEETEPGRVREHLESLAERYRSSADTIRGAMRVSVRSSPDPATGGRTRTEVVAEGRPTSMARARLESAFHVAGPLFGAFMIRHSIQADEDLSRRIEAGDAAPLEALAGTLHNFHGVTIGIRMVSLIPVSIGEFALLAVLDVAATMAADYQTDEDWWIASMTSGFTNAINLACFGIGGAMMRSPHPFVAAAGFGVMVLGPYVVGPVLDFFGIGPRAWERWFSFDPNDVVAVEQDLRELMAEYRVAVGALRLAERDVHTLGALGASNPEVLVEAAREAVRVHRQEALELEPEILEAFEEGYRTASTDHHGLQGLDMLREQFAVLRRMAHAEDADESHIVERFRQLEESIDLTDADPAVIREMDQWEDLHDAMDDLHAEVFHESSEDVDTAELFEDLRDVERMLDHARYRLYPSAPSLLSRDPTPPLRARPLLQPGPARDAYEDELRRAERRFSRFLVRLDEHRRERAEPVVPQVQGWWHDASTHEGELDPNWTGPRRAIISDGHLVRHEYPEADAPSSLVQLRYVVQAYEWKLEAVARAVAGENMDALWGSSAGIERRFDSTLSEEARRLLRELEHTEILMRLQAGQTRSLTLLDRSSSEQQAEAVADEIARAERLVRARRETHGLLYRSELRAHAQEVRAREEQLLVSALEGDDAPQLSPFETEALGSDELEEHTARVASVSSQLMRLRLASSGGELRLYSLQAFRDSLQDYLHIRTDPQAIVGWSGRSTDDSMSWSRGHVTQFRVVPITRQAISALGSSEERWLDSAHLVPVNIDSLIRPEQDE